MPSRIITWELDPTTGQFSRVSPYIKDCLGYHPEAWTNEEDWHDKIHADDRQRVINQRHNAVAASENFESSYRMHHADGSIVWLRELVEVCTDENKLTFLRSFITDEGAPTVAEEATSDDAVTYEHVEKMTGIGHWVWDEITDRLSMCSPGNATIYGLSVEDYATAATTYDEDISWVHPDDRKWYEKKYSDYVHQNRDAAGNAHELDMDYRIIRRTGEIRHVRMCAVPEFDVNGRHIRSLGTTQDITNQKQLEDELQKSEATLHAIMNHAPFVIFMKDMQGQYQFVNKRFSEWYGGEPGFAIGKTHDNFSPDTIARRYAEQDRLVLQTKSEMDFEASHVFADGKARTIMIRKFPVYGTNGEIIGIGGTDTDISDRKQAEQDLQKAFDDLELHVTERTAQLSAEIEERKQIEVALRDSEERNRDFAESSSDWFWAMDERLKLSYLGSRFKRITGFSPDAFLGKTRQELFSPGEDQVKWQVHMTDLRNRRPFRDFQYGMPCPDGSIIHVRISGTPVFEADKFVGYRGTATNITEQFLAERRAIDAERQLVDAIESLSDGVLLLDKDDNFVLCNSRCRKTLNAISHLLNPGIAFEAICRESFNNGIVANWDGSVDDWVAFRLAAIHKPGSAMVHQRSSSEWIMAHEHRTRSGGTLIIYTDITELKQTQLQFEEVSKAKSASLASMSHQIRTPLNAILGYTGAMQAQVFGPMENEHYAEYIDIIQNSGQHLLELANDILDISAIESNKLELYREPVDLSELATSCIDFVTLHANAHGVALSLDLTKELPLASIDKRRFRQILLNLLTNAINSTPPDGTVTLSAELTDAGELLVAVNDTGIGMNDSELATAMSAFGRANTTYDRKTKGTGLGLPLSENLVNLHGGDFSIQSESGKGTRIRLLLPSSCVENS